MRSGEAHFVGIGHSHLAALEGAIHLRGAAVGAPRMTFVQLLDPAFRATPPEVGWVPDSALAARIAEIATMRPDGVVLSLGGNEYHQLGAAQHARPYDFVLPDQPYLPLLPDAEIIPYALLERWLRPWVERLVRLVAPIRVAFGDLPLLALQSPPPNPDNAFLVQPSAFFARAVDANGPSAPLLRYKLWCMQSNVYRTALTAVGAVYLTSPAAAVDAAGFLRPAGWHPDGVHATAWYGELVLQQISAVLDARA